MKGLKVGLLFSLPVIIVVLVMAAILSLLAATESKYRQEQKAALQRAADSIAAMLGEHELFLHQAGDTSQRSYVASSMSAAPVLDGRTDDWSAIETQVIGLGNLVEINDSYTTASLTYHLRIGSFGDFVYLHYEVSDDFVVYREINHPSVHRNDHVQLAFVDGNGLFRRYTLAATQPGHIEAMEIGGNGRALRSDPLIAGRWLATERGYNLELQIPEDKLTSAFSTLVADVDTESDRSLRYLVGRSSTGSVEDLGHLVMAPTALQSTLEKLPWEAEIYDRQGRWLAGDMTLPDAEKLSARAIIYSDGSPTGEVRLQSNSPQLAGYPHERLLLLFGAGVLLSMAASALLARHIQGREREAQREVDRTGQYNDYLERMASRLNHELQTPVSVIRSSIEHMQAQGDDASVYVSRAAEGANRLTSILSKMSEARRLEEALDEDEIRRFDLVEVVLGCVAGYELAYPLVNFECLAEAETLPITGIPELIAQAFDKLIDNAVEFSDGGVVRVRLNLEKGEACLRVLNEGRLLPEGSSENLFESMVSVREADRETHLGLGLYVARTITAYHGGALHLSNRDDVSGVVATMRLPILRLTAKLGSSL